MDKLKLAHDYAMQYMQSEFHLETKEELIALSWEYADAMQAEADKRNKAEAAQKRKEIREMLNADNTFIEREGQHFDDVEEWQPDWSQAPEWASSWGVAEIGQAWWFSGEWYENNRGGFSSIGPAKAEKAPSFDYQGNWKESLRKRPESLCEVDWSQAPEDAVAFLKLSEWDIPVWINKHGIQIEDAPSFGFTGTHIVERSHGF